MIKQNNQADIREVQRPLKQAYKNDARKAWVTLTARASMAEATPYACSLETAQGMIEAQAHAGLGGAGTAACSGDLLLGALAACTQITVQMVAAGMGLSLDDVRVEVQGELDLRGTLGLRRDVPVGFQSIRANVVVEGCMTEEQLRVLQQRTERYCVVLATLQTSPPVRVEWGHAETGSHHEVNT